MVSAFVISIVIAYFLGAIPNSYWMGKVFRGIDIREHGSKNPGASNALRILGKPIGFTCLILDIGKGWLAIFLAQRLFHITLEWQLIFIGLAAVFGHIYTIFLKFKGGKGVATTFGIFLGLTPLATVFTILVWLLITSITRYISLASIISGICFPVFIYLVSHNPYYFGLSVVLGIFIIIRHISNIKRLMNGTENKIFAKTVDNTTGK